MMVATIKYDQWLKNVNAATNFVSRIDPQSFFDAIVVAKLYSNLKNNNNLTPLYIVGAENGKFAAINLKKLSLDEQKRLILWSTQDEKSKKSAIKSILSQKNIKKATEVIDFKDLKGYFPVQQGDFNFFMIFLKNLKDIKWPTNLA